MTRSWLALLPLLMAGCTVDHYVVLDEAPLYASVDAQRVITTLPRYHHEALDADPQAQAGLVRIRYQGKTGYAPQAKLKLFDYVTPGLDGGEHRDATVRHELREAQLAHVGGSWSPSVVSAIRDETVVRGMSRRQVELAWGWPLTIRPGSIEGGERWVFHVQSRTTVRRFLNDPFAHPSSFSPYVAGCADPFRPRLFRREVGWVSVRIPVTEERVVELDAGGRVHSVDVRRFVSDT